MIKLENIQFAYPKSSFELLVDEISFDSGSKTAITGTSGYGKSTLLNLIAGILIPQKGKVTIDGKEISSLSDQMRRNFRSNHIGFVFQDFKLIPYLKVIDNILLPYRVNDELKMDESIKEEVKSLSKELGIADKLNKYPSKISQGEQQRVAICRALINKPSILLADEPTGNLDPENKRKIMDVLFSMVEKYNATLITVTHDHDMLLGFDEVIDFTKLKQTIS